jgi:hypothetical protein
LSGLLKKIDCFGLLAHCLFYSLLPGLARTRLGEEGKEENVTLVDLNAMSKILYEAWGEYGDYKLACCIVSSIKKQKLPLVKFVKKSIPTFDPAVPMAFEKFYWPHSAFVTAAKPDGN